MVESRLLFLLKTHFKRQIFYRNINELPSRVRKPTFGLIIVQVRYPNNAWHNLLTATFIWLKKGIVLNADINNNVILLKKKKKPQLNLSGILVFYSSLSV